MSEIAVSVIIPVYNVENMLEKCMQSVTKQTLTNIEIICIDDGSSDNSLQILHKFAADDRRIKIIEQKNAGCSSARNEGMKIASGKYIGFVDSDDYIDVDFYEKLYNAAEQEQADIAACSIITEGKGEDSYIIKYEKQISSNKQPEKFKLLGLPDYNYIWNKIYLKEFMQKNNISFKIGVYYEDIYFSIHVALLSDNIVCIPDVKYHYQHNENSIVNTTESDPKKKQDYVDAISYQKKYILKHNLELPISFDKKTKIKFLGITIIKIKEITGVSKQYYFLGLPLYKRNYL